MSFFASRVPLLGRTSSISSLGCGRPQPSAGGFRPSDLLKTLAPQLDPLTEQQMVGICSLEQSRWQAGLLATMPTWGVSWATWPLLSASWPTLKALSYRYWVH